MAELLKAGIIGCGGIANGKHMPATKAVGLAELVAFCDIIPERAEKARQEYGTKDAKVFVDYKELLKEDLDVVFVCTAVIPKSPWRPWKAASMCCAKSPWPSITGKPSR